MIGFADDGAFVEVDGPPAVADIADCNWRRALRLADSGLRQERRLRLVDWRRLRLNLLLSAALARAHAHHTAYTQRATGLRSATLHTEAVVRGEAVVQRYP